MTNEGSLYNSSHPPSVLAVLVLLLAVAGVMTTNVMSLNGARCNGSIAECHGEEEELLAVGESENGLRSLLQGNKNIIIYKVFGADKPVFSSNAPGSSYFARRGCDTFNRCRPKT
ncbi:hypothetical protein QJS10_CPB15g01401 [Acorus calamus]|uniref:Uncharacterized protein n=1 Tax=Acorus calamus TaxID=4465 RepID=A0AAV9D9U5_ACOCL|nr:hypothetical protein QJS10_CPB15g01401 [Acorus calamus]